MLDRKVTLVSNNPETLDGTQTYLRRAGARAVITSRLEEAVGVAVDADAIVFFADDYPRAAALHLFSGLCAAQSNAVVIVVTEDTTAFVQPSRSSRAMRRVVVLRRPAWGWMLVEAIRTGENSEAGGL